MGCKHMGYMRVNDPLLPPCDSSSVTQRVVLAWGPPRPMGHLWSPVSDVACPCFPLLSWAELRGGKANLLGLF